MGCLNGRRDHKLAILFNSSVCNCVWYPEVEKTGKSDQVFEIDTAMREDCARRSGEPYRR